MILHSILACPLMQLGDGDGGQEVAEEGEEEEGEEMWGLRVLDITMVI